MLNALVKSIRKPAKLALITMTALSLAACGNNNNDSSSGTGGEETQEVTNITLYTGGSLNVQTFWETLLPKFEDANPDVDVELVFLPSGQGGQSTMDRLVAAKKANKDSGVNLYEGSLGDIIRGEEEGDIFEELDESMIPNLKNVDESNLEGASGVAVPYRASAVVLAYNSETVEDVPDTDDELYDWIRNHPGRFAYNDPSTGGSGSSFVLTTVYNQLPPEAMNSQDPSIMEQWDAGFQILKDLGPYMYNEGVYPRKNQGTLDLLTNGEVDMIPAWSDMALEQLNKDLLPDTIKLKQIDPAFTGGPAYLLMPTTEDENEREAAAKLLDYVLTPEAQEIVINTIYGYPGIKWDLLPSELQQEFESVSGGYRSFNGGSLSGEVTKRWQSEIAGQ
ncbi:extracellular solute-binding protein [Bacillaceae bacterium Marseille-Q3522]|nr:extracellular solute-binding protein [Bacillaceae bacterium Marseille-Q3522]